ncbi:hypothetical protein BDY21DRAFT_422386 [Lineolata rhizophorae]|uniref:Uncharacterized protein n=1 Tax=Lineolata rhizophorae TaxID=578093 RepID=A0A6A6NX34_9PEZI|nr:hypothetical protein BDY21DRAFT_422386 [Lineolata rhizophorae]
MVIYRREAKPNRETEEEFEQNTVGLQDQGLCRKYLGTTRGLTGLEICEPQCGDLATGDAHSVTCSADTPGNGTPLYTDPEGNQYTIGECICAMPFVEELFQEIVLALPAIGDIGCAILKNALGLVLEYGPLGIPGVGTVISVGMRAAISAAKTFAENGLGSQDFLDWLFPCGNRNLRDGLQKGARLPGRLRRPESRRFSGRVNEGRFSFDGHFSCESHFHETRQSKLEGHFHYEGDFSPGHFSI